MDWCSTTNLSPDARIVVLKKKAAKPCGKSAHFKHGYFCLLGGAVDPRNKERHGKVDNLTSTEESGAILSCLTGHWLAGGEKHFAQFWHHSFNVHQLEHVLRKDGNKKTIQRGFPSLTPLQSPSRVGSGIRQLVSKGVCIVLVDSELDEKPEQSTKTVLPPLAPGSTTPPAKSSTAEDIVKVAKAAGCNELSHPTSGGVSQRGSRPRGGRILTITQPRMTPQSSRSAKPVDNVESVEEALRRLWVKEGSKVAVGVNLLQALLDLRVGGEEEKDLPDSSRHDLSFCIQRQPVLPPAWDATELGHEREELGEVVLLEEKQHGDLVPAGERRKLPSEFTESAHW